MAWRGDGCAALPDTRRGDPCAALHRVQQPGEVTPVQCDTAVQQLGKVTPVQRATGVLHYAAVLQPGEVTPARRRAGPGSPRLRRKEAAGAGTPAC